ncbi:MAG TPA: hypothetical protein VFY68_13230 [Nitrososphaeraceae archaeon]|nr:hypothetical protein [Nitrososphaeraceae archaeon]
MTGIISDILFIYKFLTHILLILVELSSQGYSERDIVVIMELTANETVIADSITYMRAISQFRRHKIAL